MPYHFRRLLLTCAILVFGASAIQADDAVDGQGDPLPAGALARLGTVRLRHGNIVTSVVFSPDGKLLYSAGNDSSIRVWEASTGKERGRFKGQSSLGASLHISTDGKTLISHGLDNTVRFWDADTERELRRLPSQKDGITCLAPSRDGRLLFTGSSTGVIRQWLAPTSLEMRQLTGHPGQIKRLLLARDGKQLVSAGADGSVRVWDVGAGTQIRVLEPGVGAKGFAADVIMAMTPDGSVLATATPGRPIALWDLATLKDLHWLPEIQAKGNVLAFSPNGKVLAVGERNIPGPIRLLGVATGKELRQFEFAQIQAFAFSPDGKLLAGGGDHNVRIWDIGAARELHSGRGHFGPIQAIHLATDGKTALSTGSDRTARVWDIATGKELGRYESNRLALYGGGVVADGKSFISCGLGTIVQWELVDGVARETRQLPLLTQNGAIISAVMSPDGKWLAAASPGSIIGVWNLAAGGEPRQWTTAGNVATLAFSPDSRLLASASGIAPTQVWDVSTGKLVRQMPTARGGGNVLAFSPDGATLATYNTVLQLWEVATGQERGQLTVPVPAIALAFSPDGCILAAADFKGPIRLWDVLADRELAELTGHRGLVKPLVFTPDGKRLISGSTDSSMLVWDATAWSKNRRQPAVQLQAEDLELLWRLLADADSGKAYQAIKSLLAAHAQAVPMLKERLRPLPEVKPEQVAKWIADLDSGSFIARDKAMNELAKHEALVEAALVTALEAPAPPTPEMRRRIETVLEKLKTPNPEMLRLARAVEVLEHIDSPEARKLLAVLAGGGSGLKQTSAARAALSRSEKRSR